MSGQPKTVTQTQSSETKSKPWAPTVPEWKNLFGVGREALDATNNNPFTGNFIAQNTGMFTQGTDYLKSILPRLGAGGQEAIDLGQKTLRGDFLSPDSNPFIRAAAESAVGRVNEGLMQGALPAITDQSIASGAYGGARQDLSQERAVRDFGRSALDTTGQIYAQNYANERQLQQAAPGLIGQGMEILAAPGNAALSLDEVLRGGTQLGLDNDLAKFRERQGAHWTGVPEMAQLLSAVNGFGSSTSTGTMTQPNPNYESPFMTALKVGIGGASTIAGMGGAGGFGLWGKAPQMMMPGR